MADQSNALALRQVDVVRADDFMPLLTVDQAVQRKAMLNEFIAKVLVDGDDYGKIPGTPKPALLKPGAEKLCSIFGLAPRYVQEEQVEDWTGEAHGGEPLFYYRYKCQLFKGDRFLGEAIGSANSWEAKHRYRWVREAEVPAGLDSSILPTRSSTVTEFAFAIDKGETSGQYGKPAVYWKQWRDAIAAGEAKHVMKLTAKGKEMDAWEMGGTLYRISNPDGADVVNTCQKMAQKRALVAAVLVVTNCSDAFTQDIEDTPPIETTAQVTERRISEETTKQENGWPEPIRNFLRGLPASAPALTKFIQDALIKATVTEEDRTGTRGTELVRIYATQLREKFPKPQEPPVEALRNMYLILWGEAERLQAEKAKREKDEADSAFTVAR